RLAQVENELTERKLIDRAKRLLMDQQKLTEPAAYANLRKRAMNQGVKLAEVARAVIASADSLK
ncbi:MAG: two-component system, response regulator / RNA-binding antiterminator, partial [Paraburkholderia sp.]|nr:two-component system, response regulator / RNA-binding antiterminator [Paraburkholderia sp.]